MTRVEIDAELAKRARDNLASLQHVSVIPGDGAALQQEPCDAIFVNSGATEPRRVWLDSLRHGGRLLLPLTVSVSADDKNALGFGMMLKVTRVTEGYTARFISPGCQSASNSDPRSASKTDPLERRVRTGVGGAEAGRG